MMILSQYHIFELDTINIYSVGEGDSYWSSHFQLANNKATVDRGWKAVSCFKKFKQFMEHGRLDSILFSYLVQGDDFFVPNLSKNTGSGGSGLRLFANQKLDKVTMIPKKTTFIIVFTTIFPAGCDSCWRQRTDEKGAGEQEPGGREADGAAGGAAQGGAQPRRGGRPQIRRGK